MLIPVESLKEGMVIEENVYPGENRKGNFIIAAGTVLTKEKIEYLKTRVESVPIKFNFNGEETVSAELEKEIMSSYNNKDVDSVVDSAKKVVTSFLKKKELSYNLEKYLLEKPNELKQSINICGFATSLAHEYNKEHYGADEINLNIMAEVVLLYKLGQEDEVLDEINNRFGAQISVPIRQLNKLNTEGEVMTNLNKKTLAMVNIIKTCEHYDKLLYDVMKSDKNPSFVIEEMIQDAKDGKIDVAATRLLLNKIPLYSTGTKVVISNNLVATVIKPNEGFPTRPIITLDLDAQHRLVDLKDLKFQNITIVNLKKNDFLYNNTKEK